MKKESITKKKIKKQALMLFNENDTFSITTNHIAIAAKISSGNLYYHYKNKEDIILDIYQDMIIVLPLQGVERYLLYPINFYIQLLV